jgi:asparagine N-glycosylation enzyme membrane subunit Stt3
MKTRPATHESILSLAAILLTVAFAVIVHFAESGTSVIFVGIAMMVFFSVLWSVIRKTESGIAVAVYGVLSLIPVLGFGIVNGFWNHVVKLLLFSLHGAQLPAPMAGVFFAPNFGSPLVETVGILMFLSAMVAAIATARFVRRESAELKAARANRL